MPPIVTVCCVLPDNPPPPCVRRLPCPSNTSVRTVSFWDLLHFNLVT